MNSKIEYENIMYAVLKKYKLYHKRDDYIDLCYIGYTKAINTFDEEKGSLKNYIYNCVENEILSELRKQNAQKRQREECSIDVAYNDMEYAYIDLIADDVDLERDMIAKETNQELREAIDRLTSIEQVIIINIFELNDRPLSSVRLCKRLNITAEEMEDIKNTALAKLKEMLGEFR